jgi:hypothetical protein
MGPMRYTVLWHLWFFTPLVAFLNDAAHQRVMTAEVETGRTRCPLYALIDTLEALPWYTKYLQAHPRKVGAIHRAMGMVVRMYLEQLGYVPIRRPDGSGKALAYRWATQESWQLKSAARYRADGR